MYGFFGRAASCTANEDIATTGSLPEKTEAAFENAKQ